jgi:peptidoglycan hydrolase-like protein with peptidoglycan-binding domain
MNRWLRNRRWLALTAAILVTVAACGGDGDSGGVPHQEASSEDLEKWQTELNAVGCWAGPVDGQLGPQTEAAIKAFQAAKGLEVDGLLGPVTEGALEEAVAAGEIVCTDSGDEDGSTATATLSSAGYGPADFAIGMCSSSGESDIELQAEVNNMTLLVDADQADYSEAAGAGTLNVDGGTESDGITLEGRVESVTVGDAGNFTVTGTFEGPNLGGEEFTLTGSCA